VHIEAEVYHYGWVRPPQYMSKKKLNHDSFHHGSEKGKQLNEGVTDLFDYGPLNRLSVFSGEHPAVMNEWISRFDWNAQLQYQGDVKKGRPLHKHEKLKNRILTYLEQNFLGGRQIGGFKNYKLLK
jgi:hypothetical protein